MLLTPDGAHSGGFRRSAACAGWARTSRWQQVYALLNRRVLLDTPYHRALGTGTLKSNSSAHAGVPLKERASVA